MAQPKSKSRNTLLFFTPYDFSSLVHLVHRTGTNSRVWGAQVGLAVCMERAPSSEHQNENWKAVSDCCHGNSLLWLQRRVGVLLLQDVCLACVLRPHAMGKEIKALNQVLS